jgi:hypothetical protein
MRNFGMLHTVINWFKKKKETKVEGVETLLPGDTVSTPLYYHGKEMEDEFSDLLQTKVVRVAYSLAEDVYYAKCSDGNTVKVTTGALYWLRSEKASKVK